MKWAARSARSQAIKFDPLVARRLVAPGRVSLLVRPSNGNATRVRTLTSIVASIAILCLPKVTVLTRASETSATKRQYDRYREHWCFVLARLLL